MPYQDGSPLAREVIEGRTYDTYATSELRGGHTYHGPVWLYDGQTWVLFRNRPVPVRMVDDGLYEETDRA